MVTCGGEGVAAALQASARFVPSCVRVNTFCSRPSVLAQICMRVGRLGCKRRRGRRLERGRRRWGEGRDKRKRETKGGGREQCHFYFGFARNILQSNAPVPSKRDFYFICNYEWQLAIKQLCQLGLEQRKIPKCLDWEDTFCFLQLQPCKRQNTIAISSWLSVNPFLFSALLICAQNIMRPKI